MSEKGHDTIKTKDMTQGENEDELALVREDGGTVGDTTTTLRRCFGFADFRPGQQSVVEAVLGGRDAAVFWTMASGKSLCYQVFLAHVNKRVR